MMPSPMPMQIPIEAIKGGLYAWTLELANTKYTGHVVVRGPDADPIGEWDYEKGYEYWYTAGAQQGGANPATFTMTLLYERMPDDETLVQAIAGVRQSENEIGSSLMVPDWQNGAPIPQNPVILTETNVANGPGEYDDLYDNVSYTMPIVQGAPVMPTWYTKIENLYSIFGGDPNDGAPIQEGIVATFTEVSSSDPGWPGEGWYWYGRDPE